MCASPPSQGSRAFRFLCAFLPLASLLTLAPALRPQSAPGAIEGRVQHAVTGDYLPNARVSLKGTNLVALTDESGTYRLDNVPPGPATVRVHFSGLDEQEAAVSVASGQTAQHDIKLASAARHGRVGPDGAVQLDAFMVQSTRETDAGAITVNEQRFSASQKSVISTDQFGTIPDNNPGEFMKWLPGVSVEYFANNIVGVSVRGLDAISTEISFDGMPVASASTATASVTGRDRNFEMLGASSADIARVEVRKLRTPEDAPTPSAVPSTSSAAPPPRPIAGGSPTTSSSPPTPRTFPSASDRAFATRRSTAGAPTSSLPGRTPCQRRLDTRSPSPTMMCSPASTGPRPPGTTAPRRRPPRALRPTSR